LNPVHKAGWGMWKGPGRIVHNSELRENPGLSTGILWFCTGLSDDYEQGVVNN